METLTEKTELAVIVEQSGLEQTKANFILEKFQDYFKIASEWEQKAKALVVTDESQVAEMKMAREARLFLKEKRVEVEKSRKELKEQSLREGKAIDGIANVLKALIEPTEKYLESQEKFAEVKAKERKERLHAERVELVKPYKSDWEFLGYLGEMDSQMFDALYSGLKKAYEDKIEAEKKAQLEMEAKAKAEAEERERIRIENEALKAKALEQEKILAAEKAKAEKARLAAEAIALKEREAADKLLEDQRKKAAAEKAKQDAIIAKEREAKAKLEGELKAKKEAEAKVEADRKRQAEIEEDKRKKALLAPDKDKLKEWVNNIMIGLTPQVGAAGHKKALEIHVKFQSFQKWAIEQIESL